MESNGSPPSTTGLWNVADVAREWKCSKSFVYKLAESGQLPSVRLGALLRFSPEVVRAFADGRVTSLESQRSRSRRQRSRGPAT